MRTRDTDYSGNYMGNNKPSLHPDLTIEHTPPCIQLFGETMSRHSETLLATPEPGSEQEKLHEILLEMFREKPTR